MRRALPSSLKLFLLAALFTFGAAFRPAQAQVIVSNLSQSPTGSVLVQSSEWLAVQFNTGSQGYHLTSVIAQVGLASGSWSGVAQIVNDSAGAPGGSVVANFTFPSVTAGSPVNTTFDPAGIYTLAASTNYWFVLGLTGTGSYEWAYTNSASFTGPGSLGPSLYSINQGGSWNAFSFHPLLQVNGIPEPSPMLLGSVVVVGGIAARTLAGRRNARRTQV